MSNYKWQSLLRWLLGLRDTNPELLLPASIDEFNIIYADLTNKGGEEIKFEDRLVDIKRGDKKTSNSRLKALENGGESRLLKIKEDLETILKTGKIDNINYPLYRTKIT